MNKTHHHMIVRKSKNSAFLKQMRELIIRLAQANRIKEKLEEKVGQPADPRVLLK